MHIFEDEKTDRFGNYPIWIKGKDANPQKIHEELYRRYGGQGYKYGCDGARGEKYILPHGERRIN